MNNCKHIEKYIAKRPSRPILVRDELLRKTKNIIIISTRQIGTDISRRMVIANGTGFVKTNDTNTLKEYSVHLVITEYWARTQS